MKKVEKWKAFANLMKEKYGKIIAKLPEVSKLFQDIDIIVIKLLKKHEA